MGDELTEHEFPPGFWNNHQPGDAMSDESVCVKPRCPKCGSEARGRGRVHVVEEDRYEEGMFFECGTMVKGDGEISQTVNDCQLNELTAQLAAANAEIERLRGEEMKLGNKTQWEWVCEWYVVEVIVYSIVSGRTKLPFGEASMPRDTYSQEFAEWLTDQYRHSMNKGIDIGRRYAESQLAAQQAQDDAGERLREACERLRGAAYLDDDYINRRPFTTVSCEALRNLFAALDAQE